MKAAYFFKVANLIVKDPNLNKFTDFQLKAMRNKFKDYAIRNIEMNSGEEYDDFIKDTTTFYFTFDIYKLPRFIKNLRK